MYNSASGGNHVVVFLTFTDSKGISEYILDPWLDARIFKKRKSHMKFIKTIAMNILMKIIASKHTINTLL